MTTFVEIIEVLKNVIGTFLGSLFLLKLSGVFADDLNSYNVECPKCHNKGQWKDID